jgi:hypothetical protein
MLGQLIWGTDTSAYSRDIARSACASSNGPA